MNSDKLHQDIIRLNSDAINELPSSVKGKMVSDLKEGLSCRDEAWIVTLAEVLAGENDYEHSWLLSKGTRHAFLIIEILEEMIADHKVDHSILAKIILSALVSNSVHAAFDVQHHLIDFFVKFGLPLTQSDVKLLVNTIINTKPIILKSKEALLFQKSDGVDHVFPIPSCFDKRCEILDRATRKKRQRNRAIILHRLLKKASPSSQGMYESGSIDSHDGDSAYLADEALKFIRSDCESELIEPLDYLVEWTEIVADFEGYAYSLAEVLRIVLLDPQSAFPDVIHRSKLGGFYRQCLRISQDSIVGLKAGLFHVEHGSLACPSLVYMGRRSILGKGCLVDCVGGFVLGQDAFLGGGFIPILIHTHKHAGGSGANERKSILPAIFIAEPSSRLPMHSSGIFESYDFIREESPYKGIKGVQIDKLY